MPTTEDQSGLGGSRLAATVLLIRDGTQGLEVWVQERVSTMRNYPGMTVFPGGGVDPRDFPPRVWDSGDLWTGPSVISVARRMGTTKYKAHALVFAAVRELFEETGTLLATHADGRPITDAGPYHADRLALESHRLSLTDVLSDNELKVRSDLLTPFARWVGTSQSGNTFDTYSFLAVAPEGQETDGETSEAASAGWLSPKLLLEGWQVGLVRLVIPTYAQLHALAQSHTVAEALAATEIADLSPVIGDPTEDPRYHEFFHTSRPDRIGDF
ncbi:NUDIX hydrolase [Corynebacterium sp. A21]|uniref:NUDIX hydrolase n=1 Tax=Corynebacterium sp. A21 TaxID=3457318 RepID=UPI003FD2D42E